LGLLVALPHDEIGQGLKPQGCHCRCGRDQLWIAIL
jgi:hypothetical protein